ncbi:MAG: hypothetical protein IT343_19500 [Candidatus Melainabacteria bacterium]|nr:hypothetical protein [Candidatus Melainabacteria bacterium]
MGKSERRKHYRHFRVTALLATALCFVALPVFAKGQGWVLRQNSQTYGIVKTIVSPEGIRLELGDMRIGIMGPKWRIVFWNLRTKYTFDESLEEFQKRVPAKAKAIGWTKVMEPGKPPTQMFCGVKAKNWHYYAYNPKNRKQKALLYDFTTADNLGLPQKVMDVAAVCCYVPAGKGLPLKVCGETQGSLRVFLNTTFIAKTQVDPEIFKLPKGYTRVRSEMEVLLKEAGTVNDEDVSDLYRPFGK